MFFIMSIVLLCAGAREKLHPVWPDPAGASAAGAASGVLSLPGVGVSGAPALPLLRSAECRPGRHHGNLASLHCLDPALPAGNVAGRSVWVLTSEVAWQL